MRPPCPRAPTAAANARHARVRAPEVRLNDEVEILDRLLERRAGPVQSGGRDADRKAVASGRLLDEPVDVADRAHVPDARLGTPTARPNLVRDRVELDSADREKRVTSAPASARASAAARPIPRPAPVTIACLPSSRWLGSIGAATSVMTRSPASDPRARRTRGSSCRSARLPPPGTAPGTRAPT